MGNFELYFFLAASLVVLALAIWSLRTRELEQRGDSTTPFLLGLVYALLFVTFVTRAGSSLTQLSDVQRVAAGLAAGGLSASAVLMLARAFRLRRRAS